MSRIPYQFIAIRTDDDDSGKNTVPFASVNALNSVGAPAQIYETATGGSSSSSFSLDSTGRKQIWVEPGIYQFSVAGGSYFSVFISSATTEDFTSDEKTKLASLNATNYLRVPDGIATIGPASSRANTLLSFDAVGSAVLRTYAATRELLNVADGASNDRAMHTGVQSIATITGLQSELDYLGTTIDSKIASTQLKTNLLSPDNSSVPSTLAVASALAAASSGETPRGAWNASTNTPALASSVGTAGWSYEVSVAGTTNLNGENAWQVGDKAVFNGSVWSRIPAVAVRSIDGRTGAVILNYDTPAQAALASLPLGTKYSTKGALSVGDGGHGEFIVESATGTPDGFSRVLLANGYHGVLQGPYNVLQFGFVADYNTATMTGTDNSAAYARMIAAIPARTVSVPKGDYGFGPGTPIVHNNPMKIIGTNRRFGSRFFFFGTGPKSVRTQVKHPDDGLDDPISAGISIESPQVHFEDIYFSNAFNGTLPAGDFGSDWDTIIFNKSYSFFTMTRCRIDGYARVAGLYFDVTRIGGNCDGATLHDCWYQGFWGCKVQGPKPKTGETEILTGDTRGGGGFSDFTMSGSTRFFDMNHHSGVRASDTDGGSFYIDGYLRTPAGAIQGHKFIGTRFTSFSKWLIYVGRSSRDLFDHAHFERTTGRFKVDGVTPVGNEDVLIEISAAARFTAWVNGTVNYNCTTLINGALFYRDGTCITGTSGGQLLLAPIAPDRGQGAYNPILTSSVGGDIPGGNYSFNAIYITQNDGATVCQGRIALTSKAGLSGNISIRFFVPFENRNITNGHLAVRLNTFNVGFGTGNGVQALVSPNQTTADLYLASASGTARLTDAELSNNSIIHFSFTYIRE